jgi:S1-C subfamily serine protease
MRARRPLAGAAAAVALAFGAAACGGDDKQPGRAATTTTSTPQQRGADDGAGTSTAPTRVEVIEGLPTEDGRFDPGAIYEREAPGVVTVISVFGNADAEDILSGRGTRGLGSGFVINGRGEVATNAHVVTSGEGDDIRRASEVFVKFADGNQVPARIVGHDANADVALLRVDPRGLTLRPLPLGSSAKLEVGQPVVAIGSPFGEEQSLSVGVISALNRTIDSLTNFQISDAIQTDAAINQGNSGGPLVDAGGRVVGINSQIRTAGGGSEGVGFAVPVDTIKRSVRDLRRRGRVAYAYIGVSSVAVYPQLARRFDLGTDRGAWIQEVTPGSPAARAGLEAGGNEQRFQAQGYRDGGDVIVRVDGTPIREENDLGRIIERHRPGDRIPVVVMRDGRPRTIQVTLAARPAVAPDDRRG